MHAPMIQDLRYVMDAMRAFHEPKDQIVILATFEAFPHSTDLFDERSAIDAQVRSVHAGEKRVGTQSGLKYGSTNLPVASSSLSSSE